MENVEVIGGRVDSGQGIDYLSMAIINPSAVTECCAESPVIFNNFRRKVPNNKTLLHVVCPKITKNKTWYRLPYVITNL